MWSSIWAFAIFAAILTVTPGLDTFLVLRTSALAGRRAGFGTVIGVCGGCLMWAVASALGVSAVVATSRLAFEVLRVAGVAYLCWLGIRALWPRWPRWPWVARSLASAGGVSGVAGRDATPGGVMVGDMTAGGVATDRLATDGVITGGVSADGVTTGGVAADGVAADDVAAEHAGRRGFVPGLMSNLLNPKVGVFYLSVMPQFLPSGLHPLAGSLALGVVHVFEGLVWLSFVVLVADRARGVLTRPRVRRRLEQLAGVAFLGFGLRLALQRAPA